MQPTPTHPAPLRRRIWVLALALLLAPAATAAAATAAATPASTPGSASHFDGLHVHQGDVDARVFLLTQLREELVRDDAGAMVHGAQVRMARPMFVIGAFDDALQVVVHGDLAGKPRLLDAIVRIRGASGWQLTAGQFIAPYTRQFMTPAPKRQFIDFGQVHDRFNLNRRLGLMLDRHFGERLQVQAGVFDSGAANGGVPVEAADHARTPLSVVRLTFTPLGPMAYDQVPGMTPDGGPRDDAFRLALGLGGAFRQLRSANQTISETRGNLELAAAGHGTSLTGEAFVEQQHAPSGADRLAWGAYLQGGHFVLPARLELVARTGLGANDLDAEDAGFYSYEAGANVYLHGHHVRVGLRYRHDHVGDDAAPQVGAAGDRDSATVQLQGWM
ncbi:MAG: hypothetical protein RIT45_2009 [Pseudomonadota bacterium]